MIKEIRYRVWQFWQSLERAPGPIKLQNAQAVLSSSELALFQQLPIPDQNHSLRVLHTLQGAGEADQDLLKAALLHDIGKSLHPLRRWERIFAVLLGAFFPGTAGKWGEMAPRGLRRALVVIHQHPAWGAAMLEEVGSSQRLIELVRYHEREEITGIMDQGGVELLHKLQKADNQN
ncbi:MAG: HD domain-containing protein [Anaerolineales bacterium]|jgi:putative nucleotidyltransferase with HDIG domain